MILSFTLETAAKSRAIARTYRKKVDVQNAERAAQNSPYKYTWPDGSNATIHVRRISTTEAARIRRSGSSFFGWEWMADTIVSHGKPLRLKDISQCT